MESSGRTVASGVAGNASGHRIVDQRVAMRGAVAMGDQVAEQEPPLAAGQRVVDPRPVDLGDEASTELDPCRAARQRSDNVPPTGAADNRRQDGRTEE